MATEMLQKIEPNNDIGWFYIYIYIYIYIYVYIYMYIYIYFFFFYKIREQKGETGGGWHWWEMVGKGVGG
jgi:hypothetical protein